MKVAELRKVMSETCKRTRRLPVWLSQVRMRPSRPWIVELLPDENLLQISALIDKPTRMTVLKASCRRCTVTIPALTCGQCDTSGHLTVCDICQKAVICLEHTAYSCECCTSIACAVCIPNKCPGCRIYICGICESCDCN